MAASLAVRTSRWDNRRANKNGSDVSGALTPRSEPDPWIGGAGMSLPTRHPIDTWTRVEREVRSVHMRNLLRDICILRCLTRPLFSFDGDQPDGFIPEDMAQKALERNYWRSSIRALVKRGILEPAEWMGHSGYQMTAPTLLNPYRRMRPPIPKRVRDEVMERDGHRCQHCNATERLTLDHIFPYSLGGSDEPDNLQVLCKSCNSRKGAKV